MVLFKIYGERNSGTTFLRDLLIKNFGQFCVGRGITNNGVAHYYKHITPDEDYKLIDDLVIDIIIFRELDEWLKSMYSNPYNLEKKSNFGEFLTCKQKDTLGNKTINFKTGAPLCIEDNDKTIFEIRYYKMDILFKYFEEHDNAVIVSLKYIQNDENCIEFLKILNHRYKVSRKKNFQLYKIHTKTKEKNIKNRDYKINLEEYRDIIDKNKKEEYENFVNNLTLIIK